MHSRYAGSGSALNDRNNGYDSKSIAVRSNLQKAANQAIGEYENNPYVSRSPMVLSGHRSGAKVDLLSTGSEGNRSMADLLSTKLAEDEKEENAIY